MDDPSSRGRRPTSVSETLLRAHKLDAVARVVPGVLHELNNPLAAIVGFGELLRRDPRLPADMQEQAELLVRETARTRRLIQAILEFLRARPAERVPTSIQALVDAVVLLHGYRLAAHAIELDVDIPADLPQVELDRAQVQLLLVDLVQEAIDAIVAGGGAGRIGVAASVDRTGDSDRVAIAVSWAAGEPTGDADPDTTDRDIARRVASTVAAAHGGQLTIGAGDEGRPARVTLALPVRAATAALESDSSAAAPVDSGHDEGGDVVASISLPTTGAEHRSTSRATRVLVLDDERPIRMLLEKWLRAAGYEPVIATTGEEAVEHVRAGPFDAVLCDHRMAGMNGTDVFEAVVALRPDMARRFVFMSGDVLNPQLREFVEEHGVGLLPKPFDLGAVQQTLDGVVSGNR